MNCPACKKEEETIKIAGQLYCASCGFLLEKSPVQVKVKTPKIEPTGKEIRTEQPQEKPLQIDQEIVKLAKDAGIKTENLDELGSSAILMDILSDKAISQATEEKIKKDENLIEAGNEAIDLLYHKDHGMKPIPKKINDIAPKNHQKKKDYLESLFDSTLTEAKKLEKKEAEEIKAEIKSQKGYTRLNADFLFTTIATITTVILIWVIIKFAL